jgi:hypothetical protein
MKLWTIPFLGLPLLNMVARTGLKSGIANPSGLTTINLWVGVAILLAIARVAFVGFS